MLNTKVWERACGLARTVVEGVRVDDTDGSIVVSVRPNAKARGRCGRCRSDGRLAMTTAMGGVGGGRWMRARRRCSSKPTHHESGVARMGRPWWRCRGLVTVSATRRDFDDDGGVVGGAHLEVRDL